MYCGHHKNIPPLTIGVCTLYVVFGGTQAALIFISCFGVFTQPYSIVKQCYHCFELIALQLLRSVDLIQLIEEIFLLLHSIGVSLLPTLYVSIKKL